MRYSRIFKGLVGASVLTLALSSCSTTTNKALSGDGDNDVVTVAEVNGFSSLNPQAAASNADINAKVAYLMSSGFTHIDKDYNIVPNEKFGRVEKLSGDPLTVKYTLSDGARWSDGVPVTADDMVFSWAALSGYYDSRNGDSGTKYFQPASDTSGLNATEFPEIGDDNKSITLKYAHPFADWETIFGTQNNGGLGSAAHIVAKKTEVGDVADLTNLLKDIPRGNPDNPAAADKKLQAVAKFWNQAYNTKQMPNDKDLLVNNGAYRITDIVSEQSVTLEKNPEYASGPEPQVEKIIVRSIGTAPAQVQALRNGDVDIISPQPSMDTVSQLKEVPGIKHEEGDQMAYDHIDLTFEGVFADRKVREAFLKTVPRQEIVDRIVKPINSNAAPMNSQMFYPDQTGYDEAVRSNGSDRYGTVDIEGATQLLGGQRPTVRLMYNKDNQNRVDTFLLVQESANKAGFNVVDGGLSKTDWGSALGNGSYDAAIFGWISSIGSTVSEYAEIYRSTGGANYTKFSDKSIDDSFSELIKITDEGKKKELKMKIDKALFDSGYGMPLFNTVDVTAYSDRLSGVSSNAISTSFYWDFWNWKVEP